MIKLFKLNKLKLLIGFVFSLCLVIATIATIPSNQVSAANLPVVYLSGTLTTNKTLLVGTVYMINSTYTVSSGATLTIPAGSIIKYASQGNITISQTGKLNITGTSTSSVYFTSYKDDTLGGDSNGDGVSTGAEGDYSTAINNEAGTLNLAYGKFTYGTTPVSVQGSNFGGTTYAATTITDSMFNSTVVISGSGPSSLLNLKRNKFTSSSAQPALSVSNSNPSGIILAGTDKNIFTGTGPGRVVSLSGVTLPLGSTWTLDASSNAVFMNSSTDTTVYGTLNVGPGIIWKSYSYGSIVPIQTGKLNITGTSTSSVYFTSYKDDTLGGDSNGDGVSTGAEGDYSTAINNEAGTLNLAYGNFKYASNAVVVEGAIGTSVAATTITDSTFKSAVSISNSGSSSLLNVKRNKFNSLSGSVALSVSNSNPSGIILAGTDKNIFTGTGPGRTAAVSGLNIPLGSTWTLDSASNAVFLNQGNAITIRGTLNLGAGIIWKSYGYLGTLVPTQTGKLNITGTSTNPVYFTSYKDDTLGGDSNGDGASTGAEDDYSTAIDNQAGTLNLAYGNFKYANVAVHVEGSVSTSFAATTITDSTFRSSVSISKSGPSSLLNVKRNKFNSLLSGHSALYISDSNPSGIILAGTDKNTFTGVGTGRTATISGLTIPLGSTWTLDSASNAVFLNQGNEIVVDGTLKMGSGIIWKTAANGGGIEVSPGGVLSVIGLTINPVYFTSEKDDTLGGDSNGDGASTGAEGDYAKAIHIEEPNANDIISYAYFKYSGTALSIGPIGVLDVNHAQFSNNSSALEADQFSTYNPAWGTIPCAYPYSNKINVYSSWFGDSGKPGSSIDLLGFGGQLIPDGNEALSALYGASTTMISASLNLGDNTIPWTLFSCGIPNSPVTLNVPVTPVSLNQPSTSRLWP